MSKLSRLTPLFIVAGSAGAQFSNVAGWRVPEHFSDLETELGVARSSVALADQSHRGKIRIEGRSAATVLNLETLAINGCAETRFGLACRLRPDLFFINTLPGAEEGAERDLGDLISDGKELITVTDVTHGRAQLLLVGPKTAELLSYLCGLDFREAQFPDLTAKQSSLAKTSQLIIRHDLNGLPAYAIIGERSLGRYLWETIMEAGQDLGIRPIGEAAFLRLSGGD